MHYVPARALTLIFSICFQRMTKSRLGFFSVSIFCSSISNIFSGDNGSLIQLVPHFHELIAGVNLSERLYGEWSQATNTLFLTEFVTKLSVIPPSNW